ncbi:hypothetical protein LB505_013475 [Fusarium chuoi]|nr:hypothetical protein LB505_013475 [Fusarium chuoi]
MKRNYSGAPIMSTYRASRLPVSCRPCRDKKRRCDRNQPCSNCTQRRLTCVYENGSRAANSWGSEALPERNRVGPPICYANTSLIPSNLHSVSCTYHRLDHLFIAAWALTKKLQRLTSCSCFSVSLLVRPWPGRMNFYIGSKQQKPTPCRPLTVIFTLLCRSLKTLTHRYRPPSLLSQRYVRLRMWPSTLMMSSRSRHWILEAGATICAAK